MSETRGSPLAEPSPSFSSNGKMSRLPGVGDRSGSDFAHPNCVVLVLVLVLVRGAGATQMLPRVDKQGNVLSSFGEGHSLAHAADEREERLQQLQQGHSDERRDTQAFGRRARALLGIIRHVPVWSP